MRSPHPFLAQVKHILRKQTAVLWVWGPVTQHSINLRGIDSAGDGGGDIMELVARIDAEKGTTELLLDDFMCGFMNKLFLEKWSKYGYKLYYSRLALEVTTMMLLYIMAFVLKVCGSTRRCVLLLCHLLVLTCSGESNDKIILHVLASR